MVPQVPACLKCLHARTHITTPKQPVRFLHDSGFDSDLDGVHLERLRKNTVFVGRSTWEPWASIPNFYVAAKIIYVESER